MSTMTEQRHQSTTVVRRRRRPATVVSSTPAHDGIVVSVPRRSQATGIIFLGLLGLATILGIVGVMAQSAPVPATGPADPPPAVFVQVD